MLHVTNGDTTAALIKKVFPGTVVPWRDALHEGPVPSGMGLDELSRTRARYIANRGWGSFTDVLRQFEYRDQGLRSSVDHEEIRVWFEHDLNDQLELLQVLSELSHMDVDRSGLRLICVDTFPGVPDFRGLGDLSERQFGRLAQQAEEVTDEQFELARRAWDAFRSRDPSDIEWVLGKGTAGLRFLLAALLRHLEQFPAITDGLSRTDRQMLQAIADGAELPRQIFQAAEAHEEARFMGDSVFWSRLADLTEEPSPLVAPAEGGVFTPGSDAFLETPFTLTRNGREVLAGRADYVEIHGIDRWLGGVHLMKTDAWRWDPRTLSLAKKGE